MDCGLNVHQLPPAWTTSYELFFGLPSKIVNNLRTFGELGIVKTAKKTQSKIINQGEACIFDRYLSNHNIEMKYFSAMLVDPTGV